jgi:MFS family permease
LFCTFTVGPIWNIWITQLIPSQETTKFFSDRLGFSQLSLFVSFVVAGVFLESQVGNQKMAFVFIFLGAALARLLSGYCIAKLPLATQGIENPGAELIETKNENQSSLRYFVVFVCMLYVSVWISAPFFTAYMLHFKQFDYYEFVAITGSLVAARFFFASFIHRFLERFGTKRSMILGAFIVLWLPVMWLFSDNVFYLCFVQVVAGIGWGALELGINIFMIQNWREKDRSRVLSWFNLSMAISMTVGSYFGVWILQMYGSDSFSLLFIVSSFARVIPLAVLLFVGIDRLRLRIVSERIVTLRSGSGPASKPILYVENDSVS